MRLGYNWQFGPFELIDQLGAGWFAERLRAEGRPVPALLRAGAEAARSIASRTASCEQLGTDGDYLPTWTRPDGVLLLADVKRPRAAVAAERLGRAVGHRRRRRLPRVPQRR